MIVNEERKTSPKQRIIIILIAILMLGSTFALYAGIVLNYQNADTSTTKSNLTDEETQRFQELLAEYQSRVDEQAAELSGKYFNTFKQYRSRVKAFNAADVTELKVTDLKVGTGREITELDDVDYAAYYIGWLSDEKIFDSSFDDASNPTALVEPIYGSTNMIQGWLEGIAKGTEEGFIWDGMRIGGVREITIPSVLGYGSTDQGDIPANSPLKFIVMLIETPPEVDYPEGLEELYTKMGL